MKGGTDANCSSKQGGGEMKKQTVRANELVISIIRTCIPTCIPNHSKECL